MHEEHSTTQGYIRMVLYVGVFVLLGTGIFARYVGPELSKAYPLRLWNWLVLGFVAALGASVYGVYHVNWMLGDTSQIVTYLTQTSQGSLVIARGVFLLGLLVLSLGWSRLDVWLYPPLALGLLLTLTLTAHAGAKGLLPTTADAVHLGMGVLWGGSLLAFAVAAPGARFEAIRQALERLSRLALPSVAVLVAMGMYLAWGQLGGPSALLASDYGRILLWKLALVVGVLALAAFNRWRWLPGLRKKQLKGLGSVSLEGVLLVGVLLVSGWLASTAPPAADSAAVKLINIDESVGENRYIGQIFGQAGLIHLYLDLRDAQGNLLPNGPKLEFSATQGTHTQRDTPVPFNKSQYHSALIGERAGTWKVRLVLPEKTLEYSLEVDGR